MDCSLPDSSVHGILQTRILEWGIFSMQWLSLGLLHCRQILYFLSQQVHYMYSVDIMYIQFSRSVVSDSLWPHGPQHARPPCPLMTPGVYSSSCPSSRWCHQSISTSVGPFYSCFQSFPVSGSFQTSQLFASGGQSIGVSASASVLPMNIQDWFPLGWTGLDLLAVQGTVKSLL